MYPERLSKLKKRRRTMDSGLTPENQNKRVERLLLTNKIDEVQSSASSPHSDGKHLKKDP